MREKLIKLFLRFRFTEAMGIPLTNEDRYGQLADYLIASGVTILPEGAIILTKAEIEALNKYEERRKQND